MIINSVQPGQTLPGQASPGQPLVGGAGAVPLGLSYFLALPGPGSSAGGSGVTVGQA